MEATLRREAAVDGRRPDGAIWSASSRCATPRSVAEVSALVKMPIGVVRVLLGDLVEQGQVRVQATITDRLVADERRELIERTLRGLRTL